MSILNPNTPRPLYNTIAGAQANFCVSFQIRVIMRIKHIDIYQKIVHFGSNNDQCYIQNYVVKNRVIKRSRAQLFKTNDVVS